MRWHCSLPSDIAASGLLDGGAVMVRRMRAPVFSCLIFTCRRSSSSSSIDKLEPFTQTIYPQGHGHLTTQLGKFYSLRSGYARVTIGVKMRILGGSRLAAVKSRVQILAGTC